MPQWTYTKKPGWYPSNKVEATAAGWAHVDTGELLVAIGGLDTLNTDAASAPTFTITLPADGSYTEDDTLTFTIEATEDVAVQHLNSTLAITFYTGKTVCATFDGAASDANSLVYKYVVTADDMAFPLTAAALAGTDASADYEEGDVLTVAGGTGTAATITVDTVDGDGAILTLTLTTPGSYTVLPDLTANAVTGGAGTGAAIDLTAWSGQITSIGTSVVGVVDPLGGEHNEPVTCSFTPAALTGILISQA